MDFILVYKSIKQQPQSEAIQSPCCFRTEASFPFRRQGLMYVKNRSQEWLTYNQPVTHQSLQFVVWLCEHFFTSAPGRGVEKLEQLQGLQVWVSDFTQALQHLVRGPASSQPPASATGIPAATGYLSVLTTTVHFTRCSKTPKMKNSGAVIYSINTVELLLYSRQRSRVIAAISAPMGRDKQ